MRSSTLLRFILAVLDMYIWEPLFWLLMILVVSGIEELSQIRQGILYVSRKRRLVNAVSMIIVALVFFWFYWMYRPGSLPRLISM